MAIKQNLIWVYGKQVVLELLRSNQQIQHLVLAREMEPAYARQILTYATERNIAIDRIPKAHLQRYCGAVLHQGITAAITGYQYISEPDLLKTAENAETPVYLVLDQIQDPHNLGAIVRTAEAAGVTGLILPRKGSTELSPTVAKTSAGAIFHQALCYCDDLVSLLSQFREKGILITALHPGASKTIYQHDMTVPLALIIGSEGKGVRKHIQRICDEIVSLPLKGKVKSLNASVAAAISIYEILRQRS